MGIRDTGGVAGTVPAISPRNEARVGDVTVVTGGTGFIGASVVRRLVSTGHRVRVLARAGTSRRLLADLPVEIVDGDLEDTASLQRCLRGCRLLFHAAAMYTLWAKDRGQFYRVNVEGTRRLLRAAAEVGVGRVVYTSTVGVLGIPRDGSPGTEDTPVSLADLVGDYKRSKFLAEEEVARDFARQGLPLVIVNPSTPVGPGDVKPTPTGKIVLDYLLGKMWAYVDTGLNLLRAAAESHA